MDRDESLQERFEAIVTGPEARLPLDEAALVVAALATPGVEVDDELRRLDDLAAAVAVPTLDGLADTLFGSLGFTGDRATYYDPRNSYLHEVVRRRRGIPITLSVLMISVGRRVGVPLEGVGMPGHFLVRDKVDRSVFVDPFAGGAVLDAAGCRERFAEVAGAEAPFDERFLDAVGPRAILLRMLANLASIHRAAGDHRSIVRVQRLRLAIPGVPETEWIDYAGALAATGRFVDAARAYDAAAERLGGEVASDCAGAARRLRARLN